KDAQVQVSFNVVAPSSLGTPASVEVLSDAKEEDRVVGLVYQMDSGLVDVLELLPAMTSTEWDQYQKDTVAENGQPGVVGVATQVKVGNGVPAIVSTWPDGTATMIWLQGGTEFLLQGPKLTSDQA